MTGRCHQRKLPNSAGSRKCSHFRCCSQEEHGVHRGCILLQIETVSPPLVECFFLLPLTPVRGDFWSSGAVTMASQQDWNMHLSRCCCFCCPYDFLHLEYCSTSAMVFGCRKLWRSGFCCTFPFGNTILLEMAAGRTGRGAVVSYIL